MAFNQQHAYRLTLIYTVDILIYDISILQVYICKMVKNRRVTH